MTLLVAWAGVDTHGTSFVYIASDSRISWGTTATFDYGRKVFAFAHWPDVLGYCGDVLSGGSVFSDTESDLLKWMNCSIVTAAMPLHRSSDHETYTKEPLIEV